MIQESQWSSVVTWRVSRCSVTHRHPSPPFGADCQRHLPICGCLTATIRLLKYDPVCKNRRNHRRYAWNNKRITNWWCLAKRRVAQLENICKHYVGDLASNRDRMIPLFPGWTRLMQFYAVFNYILQPTEAANDAISDRFVTLNVPDRSVKFRAPSLNRSRVIRPKAIGS